MGAPPTSTKIEAPGKTFWAFPEPRHGEEEATRANEVALWALRFTHSWSREEHLYPGINHTRLHLLRYLTPH